MNFLLIAAIISLVAAFTVPRGLNHWRRKYKQPNYSTKLQKPGNSNIYITKIPVALLFVSVFGTVMGIIASDTEMTAVFLVLLIVNLVLFYFIQRKYDMAYQENEEYFILQVRRNEYKIHYDDIVDWQPSIHGITVMDGSQPNKRYIDVKIGMFKTEILLRKVAEMTFRGKFPRRDDFKPEDPLKKTEMVNFLTIAGYDYLIRDYLEGHRKES